MNRSRGSSYVLAVDIGATKTAVGAFTFSGEALCTQRYPTDIPRRDEAVPYLLRCLRDFFQRFPQAGHPLRIGVGVRGYIDRIHGIWQNTRMIPDFSAIPLAEQLSRALGIPSVIDNDVHCAALAELYLGYGRQCRDFIYLNIGTGIAAGIISNGALVCGQRNYAGEWGSTLVRTPDGSLASLEAVVSGEALSGLWRRCCVEYTDEIPSELLNEPFMPEAERLFLACARGAPGMQRELFWRVEALGICLQNLIALLDPALIVCGGGVCSSGWLVEQLDQCLHRQQKGAVPLRVSPNGADCVGLLGAACLAARS